MCHGLPRTKSSLQHSRIAAVLRACSAKARISGSRSSSKALVAAASRRSRYDANRLLSHLRSQVRSWTRPPLRLKIPRSSGMRISTLRTQAEQASKLGTGFPVSDGTFLPRAGFRCFTEVVDSVQEVEVLTTLLDGLNPCHAHPRKAESTLHFLTTWFRETWDENVAKFGTSYLTHTSRTEIEMWKASDGVPVMVSCNRCWSSTGRKYQRIWGFLRLSWRHLRNSS
jgi:hypothetical protein